MVVGILVIAVSMLALRAVMPAPLSAFPIFSASPSTPSITVYGFGVEVSGIEIMTWQGRNFTLGAIHWIVDRVEDYRLIAIYKPSQPIVQRYVDGVSYKPNDGFVYENVGLIKVWALNEPPNEDVNLDSEADDDEVLVTDDSVVEGGDVDDEDDGELGDTGMDINDVKLNISSVFSRFVHSVEYLVLIFLLLSPVWFC